LEFIVSKLLEAVKDEKKYSNTRSENFESSKKKVRMKITPLTPVLLHLEAQRIILEKMFPSLKTNLKNRQFDGNHGKPAVIENGTPPISGTKVK